MNNILSILVLIALSIVVYLYMTVFTYTGKAMYIVVLYFMIIAGYILYKVRQ